MKELPKIEIVHPGGHLQCTTYLVGGPQGAALVDPGSGSCEAEVLAAVRRLAWPVGHALLTHCHVDHALGAYRFRARGVRLVASPRTAQILRLGGHQVWYEYPDYVIPTEVDLTPADGEALEVGGFTLRVLHTPGHTDGCASYLVETAEGLAALTGDLISISGHPGWSGSEGFSVEATIASLEKLLAAGPAQLFMGHWRIREAATEFLERALAIGRAGQWKIDAELHPQVTPPAGFERRA